MYNLPTKVGLLNKQKQIKFSTRELEILERAKIGKTDREIAESLNISPATVKSYWVRIRHKSGAVNRTAATNILVNYQQNDDRGIQVGGELGLSLAALRLIAERSFNLVGYYCRSSIHHMGEPVADLGHDKISSAANQILQGEDIVTMTHPTDGTDVVLVAANHHIEGKVALIFCGG